MNWRQYITVLQRDMTENQKTDVAALTEDSEYQLAARWKKRWEAVRDIVTVKMGS